MSTPSVQKNDKSDSLLISYMALRKSIGYAGIFFPILLVIASWVYADCSGFQSSISHYYHTGMRDIFVAVVFAIAVFLYTYKGYDNQDMFACKLAAIFALGVAIFPTQGEILLTNLPEDQVKTAFSECIIPSNIENSMISKIHLICAAAFFLTLAYISFFLFTKSSKKEMTKQKKKRNLTYKICGIVMVACILSIAICWLVLMKTYPDLKTYKPVFFLETAALIAFGISWLVKGEVILKDINAED